MESNEQPPPAKCRKLDTNPASAEANDKCEQYKCSYASEVSRRLYSDKDTADVFFTFEDSNERISAHKCILSNVSKVFHTLLHDRWARDGDILLRETPTEAFKIVLRFCYLDEVTLKLGNITDVMKLLDHYEMLECLKLCGIFWADNWNINDICTAYDWAINLNMTEFRAFCERKISLYSDAVLETDDFLSCSFNVLDHILDLNSLLSDETAILGACLKWARKQCEINGKDVNDTENLREYLKGRLDPDTQRQKSLLYKIRYGTMKHSEFLAHIDENNGLFGDVGEYEDVMRLLCGSKNLKTGKFKMEPRKQIPPIWYQNALSLDYDILRQSHLSYRDLSANQIVSVLTVNQPILLNDFQVVKIKRFARSSSTFSYGSTITNQMSIDLSIFEQRKEIYTNRTTFLTNTEPHFPLEYKPIILKPNFEYRFQFDFAFGIAYERFEPQREIKLNKNVTVQISAENDYFIIKTCRFTLL